MEKRSFRPIYIYEEGGNLLRGGSARANSHLAILVILPFPGVAHYRAYRCMINEIMKLGVSGSSCFELRVINRRKRDKVFVTATPFLISP